MNTDFEVEWSQTHSSHDTAIYRVPAKIYTDFIHTKVVDMIKNKHNKHKYKQTHKEKNLYNTHIYLV